MGRLPPRCVAVHTPWLPQRAAAHKSSAHEGPAKPALQRHVLLPHSQYWRAPQRLGLPQLCGHAVGSSLGALAQGVTAASACEVHAPRPARMHRFGRTDLRPPSSSGRGAQAAL